MQRLFSMFPPGWPGVALLILRTSTAVALAFECVAHRSELSSWTMAVALLISLALFVGYLTPLAAVAGLVFHVSIWLGLNGMSVFFASIISLDAVALALLGPGAYSIDAYRFGRRLVVLPPP